MLTEQSCNYSHQKRRRYSVSRNVTLDYNMPSVIELFIIEIVTWYTGCTFVITNEFKCSFLNVCSCLLVSFTVSWKRKECLLNDFTVHQKVFVLSSLYKTAGHFIYRIPKLSDFVFWFNDDFFSGKLFFINCFTDHLHVLSKLTDRINNDWCKNNRTDCTDDNCK